MSGSFHNQLRVQEEGTAKQIITTQHEANQRDVRTTLLNRDHNPDNSAPSPVFQQMIHQEDNTNHIITTQHIATSHSVILQPIHIFAHYWITPNTSRNHLSYCCLANIHHRFWGAVAPQTPRSWMESITIINNKLVPSQMIPPQPSCKSITGPLTGFDSYSNSMTDRR